MELDSTSLLDASLAWPVSTPFCAIEKYKDTPVNLRIVIDKSDIWMVQSQQGPAHVQDLIIVS